MFQPVFVTRFMTARDGNIKIIYTAPYENKKLQDHLFSHTTCVKSGRQKPKLSESSQCIHE
jgi:hypothetical protein